MSKIQLKALVPQLLELDSDSVVAPNMPVHDFLQEAEDMHTWMQGDLDLFMSVGTSEEMLDSVQARIGALREAESAWRAKRHSRLAAQTAYDGQSDEAFRVLDEALHHMRFAFRRRADLISRLPRSTRHASTNEKFQMMNDLAVLGSEHIEVLEACGFDTGRLVEMAAMSDQMANLRSFAREARRMGGTAKLMRDRAFTLLKIAVDEIRETARFLFRKNPERLAGYRSEYYRRGRGSRHVDEDVYQALEAEMEIGEGQGEDLSADPALDDIPDVSGEADSEEAA